MRWHDFKSAEPELAELGEKRRTVTDRHGKEGDFKVYGRAVEVVDLEARRRYCEALFAKIAWRPEAPEFHVFALDIESAGYIRFAEIESGRQIRVRWPALGAT